MHSIVKNTTFPGPLSLLAPHSCRGCNRIGKPLCDCCKNYIIKTHQNICPICKTVNSTAQSGSCPNCPTLPPIFIAGSRNELLGELIHDLKFNSTRALARPLAEILNQTLPKDFAPSKPTIIVPLPTISKHIRARGLDHTYLIAKHLAKLRPECKVVKLLARTKNTIQVGSSRETRLTQASTAYALSKKAKVNPNATYILLDDVWTTGASSQAAHRALKKAGAKNIAIAILALSS